MQTLSLTTPILYHMVMVKSNGFCVLRAHFDKIIILKLGLRFIGVIRKLDFEICPETTVLSLVTTDFGWEILMF